VFPGEDHAGRASTLAAQGTLSPPPVILAGALGALGAIVGDSALFWIARRYADRARPRVERAEGNARVAGTLEFLGDSTKILLTFGRYVPGLRFVINSTMGLSGRPYREFLPWSALGGVLWSTYTCLLAYWIGSTLEDYPLASVVISGVVTTAVMGLASCTVRKRRRATTR
jgi:membrane-associated protein